MQPQTVKERYHLVLERQKREETETERCGRSGHKTGTETGKPVELVC